MVLTMVSSIFGCLRKVRVVSETAYGSDDQVVMLGQ